MKKHIYFLLQMIQIKTLLIHDKEMEDNKLLLNLIFQETCTLGVLFEIAPLTYYSESVNHLLLYYAYLHMAKLKTF